MSDWHRQQYRHNGEFVEDLDASKYPDWEVTGLFYAALHLVQEALIAELGTAPNSHDHRAKWMRRCARTKPVAAAYFDLRTLSNRVRYEVPHNQISEERVTEARVLFAEIEDHLAPE